MFNHNHYVPVLKWKQGERTALENLDPLNKSRLTPLIEIPFNLLPADRSHIPLKSLDDHIGNTIGEDVRRTWGMEHPLFLDTLALDNAYYQYLTNSIHFLPHIVHELERHDTKVIPVTTLRPTAAFLNELIQIIQNYGRGVCIRIKAREISNIPTLFNTIDLLIAQLGITKAETDLIFDFERINQNDTDGYQNQMLNLLLQMPDFLVWRTLTVLATSMIDPLTPNTKNSTSYFTRIEWANYQYIRSLHPNISRVPSFGDYAIGKPEHQIFELTYPKIIPKAVYTNDSEYMLFRTEYLNRNNFQQYLNIADSIVNHPDYAGRNYSYGDDCIFNYHSQRTNTGNPMTWVRVTANHHMTKVANDLANSHGS